MFRGMNLSELSTAFGDLVANSEKSSVLVYGARCDTASGVAWTKDLVVTAAHSLERERGLEVGLAGGREEATLLGADPASNIAVLRVDAELSPLPRADTSRLRTGELAVALGRGTRGAFARLGMLARVGGEWRLAGGQRVERFIQTDIAPSSGLSGSALVSADGGLIGLNLAGLARGSLVTLPAATVDAVVSAIATHGRVRRARLGVGLERVELPRALGERLGRRSGLLVLSVLEGGPAERAGLLLGDVILALGGQAVERVQELQGLLGEGAVESELSVSLLRAGSELVVSVTPEAR